MGPGGIFGNIRGAAKYLTRSNIVASRNIDLLRIDGPEFYALLKVRKIIGISSMMVGQKTKSYLPLKM